MASFVPRLGARVCVSPQTRDSGAVAQNGTVRFHGETRFKDGTWVGVELDTTKGEHDGVVNGVQYFDCAANRGIFVRPHAVQPLEMSKLKHATAITTNKTDVDSDTLNQRKEQSRRDQDDDDVNKAIPQAIQNINISSRDTKNASPGVDMDLFVMHARAFKFNKRSNGWAELGAGDTTFRWSSSHSKINLQLSRADVSKFNGHEVPNPSNNSDDDLINHLVDPKTKVDESVASQQSWVFRGYNSSTMVREVLCLQFRSVHEARIFVSTFEGCRVSMLKVIQHQKADDKQKQQLGSNNNNNNNNNNIAPAGFSDQKIVPDESLNQVPTKTRVMRRRLTVAGSNPNLDGFQQGAGADTPEERSRLLRMQSSGDNNINNNDSIDAEAAANSLSAVASKSSLRKGGQVIAFSGVSCKGLAPYNPDKQNQDSMIMQQLPRNGNCNGELLLAVFDGHGENGHLVSRYFQARMPQLLAASPEFGNAELTCKVIANCLKIVERELINDQEVDTTLSGTTAVVSVLRGDQLYVANVGDSRIVRGTGSRESNTTTYKSNDISRDHKPDLPAEQARIEAKGGRVFAMKYDDGVDGPARVWLSYADMPGLAMSRSLCDTVGKEAGVSSDAECHVLTLTENDRYLVLATDGLWEFMESNEVCDIVNNNMMPADDAGTPDPRLAITQLVKESNIRWRREEPVIDDTTVIVAYFK